MKEKKRKRRRRIGLFCVIFTLVAAAGATLYVVGIKKKSGWEQPDKLLLKYMACITEKEYEKMYEMIDVKASGNLGREEFVKRNSAIYEGVEAQNVTVEILSYEKEEQKVSYRTSLDTVAGKIQFENKAYFSEGKEGYRLIWEDALIFPGLFSTDKVRVSVPKARRGEIQDREGRILAGKGLASSVGIIPEKLENRENAIQKIASILGIGKEEIEKKLSAGWVREDSFVPVKTIPKVPEMMLDFDSDKKLKKEQKRHEKLLKIPGVMISDVEIREYPYAQATAHLTGYVQSVTAEDLQKHEGEGYTSDSLIGRSGIESLFEKELKGVNGSRIYIEDNEGKEKKELAGTAVQHGQNIKLTIDADLQRALYEQFKKDKSCSVAMNPYTGEVLALVSTPSYDSNDFIMGLSSEKWTALNEDEKKPLYNRFRQVFCPGSTFKPITAAIGLHTEAVDPEEDYGSEGLKWQKDSSWGSYYITTLHTYKPVVLQNALIYSDNIYFAKAALKIGSERLETSLKSLGFAEELPFEIKMAQSRFSNTEHIETEIQLADSGYGQGQILVNPLHMACIYSAFCNEGNIIKPYLLYQKEEKKEYWIPGGFSRETAETVLAGLKKVVNDPHGTGYAAHRNDISLAGKTGTAEIKASKEDDSGTELGWFAVFTTDKAEKQPVLMISMVEDVKRRGGSGYVVGKDKMVLQNWFKTEK